MLIKHEGFITSSELTEMVQKALELDKIEEVDDDTVLNVSNKICSLTADFNVIVQNWLNDKITDSDFEDAMTKYSSDLQFTIESYPEWATDRILSMALESCQDELLTLMLLFD